jgi:hypothetical protein
VPLVLSITSFSLSSFRLSSRLRTFAAFALAFTGFVTSHVSPFFSSVTSDLSAFLIEIFVIFSTSSFATPTLGRSAVAAVAEWAASWSFCRFCVRNTPTPRSARRTRAT